MEIFAEFVEILRVKRVVIWLTLLELNHKILLGDFLQGCSLPIIPEHFNRILGPHPFFPHHEAGNHNTSPPSSSMAVHKDLVIGSLHRSERTQNLHHHFD